MMTRIAGCVLALATVLPAAVDAQQALRGRVLEAGVGQPVAGAEVRAVCHNVRTVTAADGSWRLSPLPAGPHDIVVEHIAFAHERRRLPHDIAMVDIALTPRPVSLSALVVTAARRLQQLKDAPAATEVLDRGELRRTGASDLSAVLTERTGVTLEGGHPVGAGIMLQGLGSERVLVLLDGQPFIGRQSGKLDLARIPTAMIERVEVVKGSQSTLYGSDAMGGVVNVITRAPERGAWSGLVDVIGGSRNRLDVNASLLGSAGDIAFAADGGRRSIELVPGYAGEAGTFATRWDAALKTQWQADSTLLVGASVVALDESQRWKSGPLYSFADNTQFGARAAATWQHQQHRFAPTLYATQFTHLARRSTEPTPVADSGEREQQRLLEAELLYAYAGAGAIIDAGVEARRETITSDRVLGADRALHAIEPFAQTTFSGERWSVVPGVRLSWSEQWGTHWTPRLATLFRPTARLSLRASLGHGFRAPAFKELYMDFLNTAPGGGYRVRGNPALQPETSLNTTTSIEYAGDRVYARAQLFYNRFDDFIETRELADSAGLRVFSYGNIDDGLTWGSELELGATWKGLRAEAGYGYLVAEDRATGESLLGRPTHSARASLAHATAFGLRSSLSAVHVGRTPISRTVDALTERAAFTRFDARLTQSLPRGLELGLGIDNVANTRPQHWPEYQGRQLYLSLGWRGERDRATSATDQAGWK